MAPAAHKSSTSKPKRSSGNHRTPKTTSASSSAASTHTIERGVWSAIEHDKFLVALKLFPEGPWKMIAEQVGTRSARQVQTHAQKYYEKVARRLRGLRKDRKKLVRPEHRLDDDMVTLCKAATRNNNSSDSDTNGTLANELRTGASVRRGLDPIAAFTSTACFVATATVGSPAAVDTPVDDLEEIDAFGYCAFALRTDTFDSLLEDASTDQQTDWWRYSDGSDLGSDLGSDHASDHASDTASIGDVELSDATDSADDADSLLDCDDYYLDYLMDVVLGPSELALTASNSTADCMHVSANDDSVMLVAL